MMRRRQAKRPGFKRLIIGGRHLPDRSDRIGRTGNCRIEAVLNAIRRRGSLSGAANDAPPMRRNLDGSGIALPGGGIRMAAAGRIAGGGDVVDYYQLTMSAGEFFDHSSAGHHQDLRSDLAGRLWQSASRWHWRPYQCASIHCRFSPTGGRYFARVSGGALAEFLFGHNQG